MAARGARRANRRRRDEGIIAGMTTVTKVGNRLAMVHDAAGDESIDHLGRDIGLARYELPLVPPTTETK